METYTRDLITLEEEEGIADMCNDADAPNTVLPVSRFKNDLEKLSCLFEGNLSSRVTIQLNKNGWVSYGIGDVSSVEYRTAVRIGSTLYCRYVQWASSES